MAGLRVLLTLLVNLVLIHAKTEVAQNYTHLSVYANAIGKAHYNPWACNYRSEPGYKCISCSAALHCFPANFALLVQCAGLFPFCRNGYCSRFRTDGCYEEHTFAEGTHGPLRVTTTSIVPTTMPAEVNEETTVMTEVNKVTTVMNEVNEKTTAMPEINTQYDIVQHFLDGGDISNFPGVETKDGDNIEEIVSSSTFEANHQMNSGKDLRR